MEELVKFSDVNDKIITVRDTKVILDSDVAALYGVETKRINEAVSNNPDKFPGGYILDVSIDEANASRSKFSTLKRGENLKYPPKAFTEKGLYMPGYDPQKPAGHADDHRDSRSLRQDTGVVAHYCRALRDSRRIQTEVADAKGRRDHRGDPWRRFEDDRHRDEHRTELCRAEIPAHYQTKRERDGKVA